MMVAVAGRERTEAEFSALFRSAGFALRHLFSRRRKVLGPK